MSPLKAHYFQHVPFEGLGSIETWLLDNGYDISCSQFFDDQVQLPSCDEVDLLVVMGGPMSVNDEAELPWLAVEKGFIRQMITAGKPVLGICLGAQLIASCTGAAVYGNNEKEIGWFAVTGANHGQSDLFCFPDEFTAFHWHGETYDLPEGATLLASSHACVNQAFQLGQRVLGMQFHLETTPDSAQALVKHCGDELVAGDFVQSAGQILFAPQASYQEINALMAAALAYITR